ncbi:MAG: hypothetical protein OEM59_18700, partial [Rhodospirillales bacterium]|nr:hypothetical protein [Rhodospirillales bacterium]
MHVPRSGAPALSRAAQLGAAFATLVMVAAGAAVGAPGDALANDGQTHPNAQSAAGHARALEAQEMTQALVGLSRRHARASEVSRPPIAAEMVALAEERRALLAELMAEDPGEVMRLAVPDHVARRMPAEVQDLLEQRVELEGEFAVFHVDGVDPADSYYEHILTTPAGERFSLHFANGMPDALTGTEIRANGVFLEGAGPNRLGPTDGSMALGSGEEDLEVLACCGGSGGSISAAAPQLENTFGQQRTVVLMVNFQDDKSKPYTASEIAAVMDGSSNDFLLENSYGQTWLNTDIFGWYTLPLNSSGCPIFEIKQAAQQAAQAAGVDLTPYVRFIYAFPKNDCPGAGLSTIGGNPSDAWIYSGFQWSIVTHEVGHGLGLYHSHSLDCGTTPIGGSCTSSEYGDIVDLMGSLHAAHFNAFQKERLGWLGYGASPPLNVV